MSDDLELELQVAVRFQIWVLGPQLWSDGRAVSEIETSLKPLFQHFLLLNLLFMFFAVFLLLFNAHYKISL